MIKSLLVLFLMVFMFTVNANETWKVASLNWQPYADSSVANQGTSIEKLRVLLKKQGITLVVEFYPWKRAKLLAATNTDFVGVYPAWSEDVFDNAIISPAVDWSTISILKFTKKPVTYDSIDQLFEKYTVGIIESYTYPKVIADAINKYPHHVENASNELSLLKKLSVGRSDVAITDPKVMLYLADKENIANIEIVAELMKKELVLAFRNDKENRKRLKLISKLIKDNSLTPQ